VRGGHILTVDVRNQGTRRDLIIAERALRREADPDGAQMEGDTVRLLGGSVPFGVSRPKSNGWPN